MKMHHIETARKKALQSNCRYKISALGFNKKGELIYTTTNRSRFTRKGGGIHAEMDVMSKAGPSLRYILICRVNKSGDLLTIHPCDSCKKKADELGVKIYTTIDTR